MGRTGTSTVESAISTVRTRLAIKPAVIHVQHVTRVCVRDLTVLCPGPLYLLLRIYGPAASAACSVSRAYTVKVYYVRAMHLPRLPPPTGALKPVDRTTRHNRPNNNPYQEIRI